MRSRKIAENALGVTIRPPFEPAANVVMMRSISVTLRASTGFTSRPNEGAAPNAGAISEQRPHYDHGARPIVPCRRSMTLILKHANKNRLSAIDWAK